MVGEPAELIARQCSSDEMTPYERLLGDALRGDSSLFARGDSVEAAWRVIDPILEKAAPVFEYEPDTWGPAEAEHVMGGEHRWHNPAPPTEQCGEPGKTQAPR